MDPRGDMGESEQQAENRRTAGWMRCPSGWMTNAFVLLQRNKFSKTVIFRM
jgi:hypothetical protein